MVKETADAGFNVFRPLRTTSPMEVRQVTEWCRKHGIPHIAWMLATRRMDPDRPGGEGKRVVWASRLEDELRSPNSDELWKWIPAHVLEYARTSSEMPELFGVLLESEDHT